ncbi:SDR family oxidoreductase [Kamptonema cortianum]|nr:SDR family oxidoreductase [Kamptonema cortianum]
MKLFITGTNGFVGASLLEHFRRHLPGHTVIGLARRTCPDSLLTNYSIASLRTLLDDHRPDWILNAAGPASVAGSMTDPKTDFEATVTVVQHLLEAIRISAARPRLVMYSSAAVYGNPDSLPVAEDARPQPISPYGHHKLVCEFLCREYSICYGLDISVFRIFSLFGPRQRRLLTYELARQALTSDEIVIKGTGHETRDFMSIFDLCQLTERLLSALPAGFQTLNVASGTQRSVLELADVVNNLTGRRSRYGAWGRRCPETPTDGRRTSPE